MPDRRFYVKASNGTTSYVPAQYLMRNGAYVMNPTPGGSQGQPVYSDSSGSDETDGKLANPYNYLIAPADYTEPKARDFAAGIEGIRRDAWSGGDVGATLAMANAFLQGRAQDLQRNPQWGVPEGSVAKAFIGAASNHLGYVTGYAGLPKERSKIGGGVANTINGDFQRIKEWLRKDHTPIDTSGPYGLSRQNDANIDQGYADGVAARQTSSPFDRTRPPAFDDYGYRPQPARRAGQIGDGGGIVGLIAAQADIDPQEPAPPAWPPLTDRPIRYVSRVR